MKASFHHNLMANHDSRNPRLGPGTKSTKDNEIVDMRNNVIYNWCGNSCYGGEAMHVNIVNNYYKPGPATPTGTSKRGRIIAIDKKTSDSDKQSYPAIFDTWGDFLSMAMWWMMAGLMAKMIIRDAYEPQMITGLMGFITSLTRNILLLMTLNRD